MDFEISLDAKQQISYMLDTFLKDDLDIELSSFRLESFTEHCIKTLSPVIYNAAIKDAHAYVSDKLIDMEADLYAEERKA